MKDVSQTLLEHYARSFREHGCSPQGVDWGPKLGDHALRLDRMLAVLLPGGDDGRRPSLLDVGCGYGALLDQMKARDVDLEYMGIDVCTEMVGAARQRHPAATWQVADVLALPDTPAFDYVVCNGILTQKLDVSIKDMDRFAQNAIRKMFRLCRRGIAFNVMSTHVNFMTDRLYYRNPVELLAWCMSELTPQARLDHAYPLYEYTIYLFRRAAIFGEPDGTSDAA